MSDIPIVHPDTGEVVEALESAATDRLCDLKLALEDREREMRQMRSAIEFELRSRLEREGRRLAVVGDYEISVDSARTRVWDADDLEVVLRDLVGRGMLQASEVSGLISREVKVDGRKAQRLLGALIGEARDAVAGCFRWERRGNPRLLVTRVSRIEAPQ